MKPAQAGATTPLPESCRAASSARIASRVLWSAVSLAESAVFVAYEASSVASALAPWSAVMLALRRRRDQGHLLFWCLPQRRVQVESREASALASACRGGRRPGPPW